MTLVALTLLTDPIATTNYSFLSTNMVKKRSAATQLIIKTFCFTARMDFSPSYSGMTSNSVANELRKLTSDERTAKMKNLNCRLASFGEHWPHHGQLSKQRMAAAGLYYNGPGDKVTCPYCKVFIECWDPHDDPMTEHRNLSHTGCPFINQHEAGENASVDESMDTAGPSHSGQMHNAARAGPRVDPLDPSLDAAPPEPSERDVQPVAPELHEPMRRLQSFSAWPRDHRKRPDELFPAGFYYTGIGDKVRCYSCGGELNRWQPNDVPWVEHAKYHPYCEFVRAKKTQFFIDQVQRDHPKIVETKNRLREYARSRGFEDYDITQVLERPDPYESEEDMYSAILALENDGYNRNMAAADDSDEAEGKYRFMLSVLFIKLHQPVLKQTSWLDYLTYQSTGVSEYLWWKQIIGGITACYV